MDKPRINAFEVVLLIVGLTVAILGFHLINLVFKGYVNISWLMLIAIFNWLMLLIIFISLSISVDVSKKQLAQMEIIASILDQIKGKKGKKM